MQAGATITKDSGDSWAHRAARAPWLLEMHTCAVARGSWRIPYFSNAGYIGGAADIVFTTIRDASNGVITETCCFARGTHVGKTAKRQRDYFYKTEKHAKAWKLHLEL